jgi:hypothetical protein
MFGRFGRELARFLAMVVGRRDLFLRLVAIALIALVGGLVAMMFDGGVATGGPNMRFPQRDAGHRRLSPRLSLPFDVSGTMRF